MIRDYINQNKIINTIKPFLKNEQAYLVGGYIRDCLLGKSGMDIDIVVPADKGEITARALADSIKGYFIELDAVNKIYRVVLENKIDYIDIADCCGKSIEEDL